MDDLRCLRAANSARLFQQFSAAGPMAGRDFSIRGDFLPIPYFILAAALVAGDQLVKFWVRANIPLHTHLDFLPGMDLTYVQNTGAAFSMFSRHTWMLTLLSGVVAVILAIVLARRVLPHWSGQLSLALLLGGAIGNFIDRLLLGYVTDMFATTFMNFAVFNVADIGVVVGGVLLCVHVLFFMRGDKGAAKA